MLTALVAAPSAAPQSVPGPEFSRLDRTKSFPECLPNAQHPCSKLHPAYRHAGDWFFSIDDSQVVPRLGRLLNSLPGCPDDVIIDVHLDGHLLVDRKRFSDPAACLVEQFAEFRVLAVTVDAGDCCYLSNDSELLAELESQFEESYRDHVLWLRTFKA